MKLIKRIFQSDFKNKISVLSADIINFQISSLKKTNERKKNKRETIAV